MTKPPRHIIRARTVEVLVKTVTKLLEMTDPETKYILILDGPIEESSGHHAMS